MKRTSIGLTLAIGLALVCTGASQVPNDFKEQLEELARAESKWLASKTDTYGRAARKVIHSPLGK